MLTFGAKLSFRESVLQSFFKVFLVISLPFTFFLFIELRREGKAIKHHKRFHSVAKKKFQISRANTKITAVIVNQN